MVTKLIFNVENECINIQSNLANNTNQQENVFHF